jgi:hypothetical protein
MSPRKNTVGKESGVEVFGSSHQAEEVEIFEATYDDTSGLLQNNGETLKWGEVYYMFKKSNFSIEVEESDEIQAYRNIKKSGIFRVETHPTVFPCVDSISWILKNIDINSRYVCNARKEPIASFRPKFLAKFYHIEEGNKRLDDKLLSEFEYTRNTCFPNGIGQTRNLNINKELVPHD